MSGLVERLVLRLVRSSAFALWAEWMERRGSLRRIRRLESGSEEDYLDRYYLLQLRSRGRVVFGAFLHRFWASDQEGVHCHPWPNLSLVLTGGYEEWGHDGVRRWRRPGAIRFRQAEVLHRVTVPAGLEGKVWTLFFHGPRWRTWGFLRGSSWEPNADGLRPPQTEGAIFPRCVRAST